MLGRYKGRAARAWAAAVAAYEKADVYLADCAQLLTRNTDVEAKSLKGRMAKLQTEAAEYAQRDAPTVRAAKEARDRFEGACAEFGLPAEGECDYERALRDAVEKRVPEVLASAVEIAKGGGMREAVAYYDEFVRLGGKGEGVCLTVHRVLEGDVAQLIRAVEKKEEEVAEVDWGISAEDGGEGNAEGGEIDWGIEIDVAGEGEAIEGDAGAGSSTAQGGAIDWNDGGNATVLDEVATEVDMEEGEERKEDSFTLADASSREAYLHELIELDAFLGQRVAELSRSGDSEIGLVLQQWSERPSCMSRLDRAQVDKLRDNVRDCTRALNGAETRRLLALQRENRVVARAARDVVEKKHAAERMHAAIDAVRRRKERTTAELKEVTKEWAVVEKETAAVKRRTEKALAGLYRGRRVVIMGEINQVFAMG